NRLRRILGAVTMDVTPLRVSRDYRLLYAGQFVSAFGSAISYVVLPWQMYQITKSTLAVGMLGVAEFVPMFVMAFVGGALADYLDRRNLVLLAEAAMAVLGLTLAANALLPQPRVSVLIVVAALFAACNSVHRPALQALIPRIVPLDLMPAVAALGAFSYSVTFIVGSSLAGGGTAEISATLGYTVYATTFLGLLPGIFFMRGAAGPPSAAPPRPRS